MPTCHTGRDAYAPLLARHPARHSRSTLSLLRVKFLHDLRFSLNTHAEYEILFVYRGVLAQLVERLNGIEEVRSSNLLGSRKNLEFRIENLEWATQASQSRTSCGSLFRFLTFARVSKTSTSNGIAELRSSDSKF